MFSKVILTVVAGCFTAFVVMQNLTSIQLRLFTMDVTVPLAAVIGCFLGVGFFVGLLWRSMPHFHRGKNQVPLIRADMRVFR